MSYNIVHTLIWICSYVSEDLFIFLCVFARGHLLPFLYWYILLLLFYLNWIFLVPHYHKAMLSKNINDIHFNKWIIFPWCWTLAFISKLLLTCLILNGHPCLITSQGKLQCKVVKKVISERYCKEKYKISMFSSLKMKTIFYNRCEIKTTWCFLTSIPLLPCMAKWPFLVIVSQKNVFLHHSFKLCDLILLWHKMDTLPLVDTFIHNAQVALANASFYILFHWNWSFCH